MLMTLIFNTIRVSHDACLVQIWWFQSKSVTSNCTDKPNYLGFLVSMAKMTLKLLPFSNSFPCMFDANFVIPAQICDELSRGQLR